MGITALFNLAQVQINSLDFRKQLSVQNTYNLKVFALIHYGNAAVIKVNYLIGIFDYRTGIRCQKKLAVTNAYHQRTLPASRNNLTRISLIKQCHSVSTYNLMQRKLDRSQQIKIFPSLHILNKLYQHFRVRIRTKCQPFCLKFFLQVSIILNYAIMYYCEIF